jgi:hypothetical protein
MVGELLQPSQVGSLWGPARRQSFECNIFGCLWQLPFLYWEPPVGITQKYMNEMQPSFASVEALWSTFAINCLQLPAIYAWTKPCVWKRRSSLTSQLWLHGQTNGIGRPFHLLCKLPYATVMRNPLTSTFQNKSENVNWKMISVIGGVVMSRYGSSLLGNFLAWLHGLTFLYASQTLAC